MGVKPVASVDELTDNKTAMWYYQKLDVKGGFASITGTMEGWKEFVLYRKSDGIDFIGEMTVGCGPACDYEFKFYTGLTETIVEVPLEELILLIRLEEVRQAHWKGVQEKYPVEYAEDYQYRFIFPQKGTDLKVDIVLGADEVQIPFAVLGWNKMEFIEKLFVGDFAQ